MNENRLGRGAALLSTLLLVTGCESLAQNSQPPSPTPCVITGEIGAGGFAFSEPYVIRNRLPQSKISVVNPAAMKVFPGIASHEIGERVTVAHDPKLEVIFEANSTIKFEVACHTNIPMA